VVRDLGLRYRDGALRIGGGDDPVQARAAPQGYPDIGLREIVALPLIVLRQQDLGVVADLDHQAGDTSAGGGPAEVELDLTGLTRLDDLPLLHGRRSGRQDADQTAQVGPAPVLVPAGGELGDIAGLDGARQAHAATFAYLS